MNILYIAENNSHRKKLLTRKDIKNRTLIVEWLNRDQVKQAIAQLSPQFICYLPSEYSAQLNITYPDDQYCLYLISPSSNFPLETAQELQIKREGWLISTNLFNYILNYLEVSGIYTSLEMAQALDQQKIDYQWKSLINPEATKSFSSNNKNSICLDSKVMVLIPYYNCESFLYQCLNSLVHQTRPANKIIVIDDNSEKSPLKIVKQFANVSLIRSSANVGPYRLIQQVIEDTIYDAYLFQDADDWSTQDRLEKLLKIGEQTGAALIGCQEWRVNDKSPYLTPVYYPQNVNQALAKKPGHPLLHPTSLVTRNLVMGLGGFATGLRFGGDTEFLLRAIFAAKIVNIADFCYFRRKRANSLTTHPETGLDSPKRKQLLSQIKHKFYANLQDIHTGKLPDLSPLCQSEPIKFSSLI